MKKGEKQQNDLKNQNQHPKPPQFPAAPHNNHARHLSDWINSLFLPTTPPHQPLKPTKNQPHYTACTQACTQSYTTGYTPGLDYSLTRFAEKPHTPLP